MDTTEECILNYITQLSAASNGVLPKDNDATVIVDGPTLKFGMDPDLKDDFLKLCCSCRAVIVCRASPMQKAEIVELVTIRTGAVTLAIGDGANDVAMIQKAHVGVGISGLEGLQASLASDYAIAQFRFLKKLLFVHGAWNYDRLTKLIFYSYYKNICLHMVELCFAMYSGWSAQAIAMGAFFTWIGNSLLHSMCNFWFTYWLFGPGVLWSNGKVAGYLVMGNFIYTYVVVV
ncbi:unnamed protein product, partial [Orchesella dallaii]